MEIVILLISKDYQCFMPLHATLVEMERTEKEEHWFREDRNLGAELSGTRADG
ncbi:hypothetical protein HO173_006085 [Letharia columbiana]|uniref:Uncharacterized protein n=1 Tax=Letharia columbiana TaxID=112416 RepID=A0A8H6FW87_9LECA|nr:uncharacterized protein HO173_006085 [Letharia columbiana]KAF6235889.1 hypothetical protein HO173_006085 [Letharia columbiana]